MNFAKELSNITSKGALKQYNSKGFDLKFSAKSEGHSLSGSLKKENVKYTGTWFGWNVSKD